MKKILLVLFVLSSNTYSQTAVEGEKPWPVCGVRERNAPVTGVCIYDPICKSGRTPAGVCRPALLVEATSNKPTFVGWLRSIFLK